ncbi:hypothetical protein EIP91_011454 [Steccherinum ochraceum]|uniref:Uncharacterized protein n=1 Tax=Steccherinum ochraceum TaxID=92696 RepID=A0A4R0RKV1_9APHY|nr:hypothetical protein EIP91_011454 [Steccherinum ochraceum]
MTHNHNTRQQSRLVAEHDASPPVQQILRRSPRFLNKNTAAAGSSHQGPQGDLQQRGILSIFERVKEAYPDADRISIELSETGKGVHFHWNYPPSSLANDSDAGTESSDASYSVGTRSRSSSLSSLSSLSSIGEEEEPQPGSDAEPVVPGRNPFATPRQNVPYVPVTALRTPRKAFLEFVPRPVQWDADSSPDEPRHRRVAPPVARQPTHQGSPSHHGGRPLEREDTIRPGLQQQQQEAVTPPDVVSEAEERRGRELREARTYHEQMAILRANSEVQQRALQAAQAANAFDEDQHGNDINDMDVDEPQPVAGPSRLHGHARRAPLSVIPEPLETQMTSDVLLQLPTIYPRDAVARFYRDPSGRWLLEGALETDLLGKICENTKEMTEGAFRMTAEEWQYLQNHTEGLAMAKIRAPLTNEDRIALELEAANFAALGYEPQLPLGVYSGSQVQPGIPASEGEGPQAGPSRLQREDTEIIHVEGLEVEVTRRRATTFPVGRRIQ